MTYDQVAQRYGPGRHEAHERYDELSMRDHLARAYTTLRARGEYDPAKHGTGNTEPLTAVEHLELLALGEYLARSYKPVGEVDHALRAGATWRQVAEVLDTDEAEARVAYRAWADGQHDMLNWTEGRLGMSDAEYAEAIARAGELDPGAAKAYAATHRVLCAHADDDGQGAHWLAPRNRDQARPPLVPVRAPLRVAPPVRSPRPLAPAPFRQALAFSADNPGMRPRCWTCGRFVGACRECGARYCKRCQPMQHEHGWEPKRQHEQVRRRSLRRLLGGHLRP